jgi:ferric-dicitrate binding protein FerR (iron transport regulator)
MTRKDELIHRFLEADLDSNERLELEGVVRADAAVMDELLDFYQQDRLLQVLVRPTEAEAVEAILAAVLEEDRFVDDTMRRAHDLGARGSSGDRATERGRLFELATGLGSKLGQALLRPAWAVVLVAVGLLGALIWMFPPVNDQPTLSVTEGPRITLQRDGHPIKPENGLRLLRDDLLTGAGTNQIGITYGTEATRISLRGPTEIKVLSWANGKQLEVHQGTIEASAARQRPLQPLVLLSPHAKAQVVGTRFSFAVGTNFTRLEVSEGRVRFTRLSDGTNASVLAGQYAVAAADYQLLAQPLTGRILREYWTNMPGELWINILTSNPDYPDHPSGREYLNQFEAPRNWGKDYGARICGFVHPPRTGDYTFWLSGSSGTGLWLSPDDDPRHARQVATARNDQPYAWTQESFQQTPTVHLIAGRKYFIQALQKHGRGADHLEVAWQGPGREREIIPGEFISPLPIESRQRRP